MKYLKLTFKNSGFFNVHNGTKDYVVDLNGVRKRKHVVLGKQQKASISVNQISNMLHVLMGERPSATYRETLISPIKEIFDMANASLIKINNPRYSYLDKKTNTNRFYYQSELINTRKSAWNSFSKTKDLVYWRRLENILTDDGDNSKYIEMVGLFSNILGYDVTRKPAEDVVCELRLKHPNNNIVEEFKKKLDGKTPVIRFIEGNYWSSGGNGDMNLNHRTLLTTNNGIEKIIRLSGEIILPLEDIYIEKIRNSKSTASLLDGGVVWIEDLIDEDDLNMADLIDFIEINKLEEHENNN